MFLYIARISLLKLKFCFLTTFDLIYHYISPTSFIAGSSYKIRGPVLKYIIKTNFLVNRRDGRVINGAFWKIGEEEKHQIEINLFIFVIRFKFSFLFFFFRWATNRIGPLYFKGHVSCAVAHPAHHLSGLILYPNFRKFHIYSTSKALNLLI